MKNSLRAITVALTTVVASIGQLAHAEIIDELDVRKEGNHAIVRIKMNTPVALLRSTSSRGNDLAQAYYQVLRSEPVALATLVVPGERKVLEIAGLPRISVSDEPVRVDLLQDINRRLVVRLDKATRFKVRAGRTDREIELVLEGLGPRVNVDSSKAPQPGTTGTYVIALARSEISTVELNSPIPAALQDMQVFTIRRVVHGKQVFELDLGYFATRLEAESALRLLQRRFPKAELVKLADEPTPPAPAEAAGRGDPNDPAELLIAARTAFEGAQYDSAADILARILDMPASSVSPHAQAMMGDLRAAQGDDVRATLEYETFLKLYPQHTDAPRIEAQLNAARARIEPVQAPASRQPDGKPTLTGAVSQYYYGGKSTSASQAVRDTDGTILPPDEVNLRSSAPISQTDQKLISTNVETTWRSLDKERDIRMVVRDQFDYNMLDEARLRGRSRSRNRLTAAYHDYQSLRDGYRTRLGRQSAAWGGEGRYDGGAASYTIKGPSKVKLSAMLGKPIDKLAESKRQFAGASLDVDAITPNIGGSVFVAQRYIDGEVDRRATGVDLHYYTQSSSLIGSTDYDVILRRMNLSTLIGNHTTADNIIFNMLIERRSLAQGSLGQNLFFQFQDPSNPGNTIPLARTIGELQRLTGKSIPELRELVRRNTAYSSHAMGSVSIPVSAQWNIVTDYHLNRTGAIAPNEVLPQGNPATGLQRTVGLQFLGSNLLRTGDSHTIGASYLNSSQFTLRQASYTNLTPLDDSWQAEPSVRWQKVVNQPIPGLVGSVLSTTTAWGPGFKLTYRPSPSVTLESNLNVDFTKAEGLNIDTSTRYTYFVGYRYDY